MMLRLLILACTACLVACGGAEPASSPVPEDLGQPVVLLVSIDTTRADALSCYREENHWGLAFPADSRPVPHTPTLDALASGGARFRWALAHAPTTLSSHTAMLSGRDSHRHGVVRNGYSVPSDIPLVQERFAEAGWDTVAVLGSSALEAKMKLGRGFRDYHDPGPQPPGGMYMLPAEEVTRRALSRVDARAAAGTDDAPLFLFVHYYDPHMPWVSAPPATVARFASADYKGFVDGSMAAVGALTKARVEGTLRYGDARHARALYLAQVAHVDAQLAVLLDGLRTRGLLEDAVVMVVSDHGEALDEPARNPYTHGPSVALWDVHVPWIVHGTGEFADAVRPGTVVEGPVGLRDVAATLSGLTGLGTAFGDGLDRSGALRGLPTPSSPVFSEATKPMKLESNTSWNNLPFERAVGEGRTWARYRPLERGLASLHAIAPGQPGVDDLARLKQQVGLLQQWDAAAPAYRPPEYDAETEAALRALGYLE